MSQCPFVQMSKCPFDHILTRKQGASKLLLSRVTFYLTSVRYKMSNGYLCRPQSDFFLLHKM